MSKSWTKESLAACIDHTLLKATATSEQIRALCSEAARYGFASVCVNPKFVSLAAHELRGQKPKVCTVVGFPLGSMEHSAKADEAKLAAKQGATEIDMVIDLGAIKEGDWAAVESDVKGVVKAAGKNAIVKVILECCYLSDDEKTQACQVCKKAGAAFVKTSTGFGPSGATLDDVVLMRKAIGPEMGLKAAGGIRTTKEAIFMLEAGATRIGASCGVEIISMLTEN
jgi:deoxyribose-phosphate aldolase